MSEQESFAVDVYSTEYDKIIGMMESSSYPAIQKAGDLHEDCCSAEALEEVEQAYEDMEENLTGQIYHIKGELEVLRGELRNPEMMRSDICEKLQAIIDGIE